MYMFSVWKTVGAHKHRGSQTHALARYPFKLLQKTQRGSHGLTTTLHYYTMAWLKMKQEGLRRFWSMFLLTWVPFWYRFFEPQPHVTVSGSGIDRVSFSSLDKAWRAPARRPSNAILTQCVFFVPGLCPRAVAPKLNQQELQFDQTECKV